MATAFKRDQQVRIKAVIPSGPVLKFKMDEETGEVMYLIGWTDVNGDAQERWFSESELEAVPE